MPVSAVFPTAFSAEIATKPRRGKGHPGGSLDGKENLGDLMNSAISAQNAQVEPNSILRD
jgi:hypothetical protein